MSLTMGTGPFGRESTGRFNFTRSGPAHVLYWEDQPKRVRLEVARCAAACVLTMACGHGSSVASSQTADPSPVESAADLSTGTGPSLVPGEYHYSDPSGGRGVAVIVGDNDFLRAVPSLDEPEQILAVYGGDVYFVYPDARLVSAHRGGASEPIVPDAGLLDPVFLQRAASGELPDATDASIIPAPWAETADGKGLVPVPSELTITTPDGTQRQWALTQPQKAPSITPEAYIAALLEEGYELQESVDPGVPDETMAD